MDLRDVKGPQSTGSLMKLRMTPTLLASVAEIGDTVRGRICVRVADDESRLGPAEQGVTGDH